MSGHHIPVFSGENLDDDTQLTLAQLSRACAVHAEWIMHLVEEGVLEPQGPTPTQWRFSGLCLRQARVVIHLQRDLRVNLAGAALALELMEQIECLHARLRHHED